MVMLDIEVSSIGRQYDFSLEEQIPIRVLLTEITEVICQKESCHLKGRPDELVLCSKDKAQVFSRDATLSQYKVINGEKLILL